MLRPIYIAWSTTNDLVAAQRKIKPDELALLEALLEVFAESTTVGEYFRGGDLKTRALRSR